MKYMNIYPGPHIPTLVTFGCHLNQVLKYRFFDPLEKQWLPLLGV
jgi:hypothetical protein